MPPDLGGVRSSVRGSAHSVSSATKVFNDSTPLSNSIPLPTLFKNTPSMSAGGQTVSTKFGSVDSISSSSSSGSSVSTSSSQESYISDASSVASVCPPTYLSVCPMSPPATPEVSAAVVPSLNESSISLQLDAPSVLETLFPVESPIFKLAGTEEVDLSSLAPSWKGAIIAAPTGIRTLYVQGGSFELLNLRETICDLLETAEEELEVGGVVLALEKKEKDLGDLLHSLLYVGGTITDCPYAAKSEYVLVGLDV